MRGDPDLNRLHAALLLSCLLHAMLLLASMHGVDRAAHKPGGTNAVDMLVARLSPLSSAELSPRGQKPESARQPQAEPPPTDKEVFFAADKLTKRPRATGAVNLDIPEAGLLTNSGRLVLQLWIDKLGKVVSVEIEQSELPAQFTTAMAATFVDMRFEPGELYGRTVGSIIKIEITHNGDALSSP